MIPMGLVIAAARQSLGDSIKDASRVLGLSDYTIALWETFTSTPDPAAPRASGSLAEAIARYLSRVPANAPQPLQSAVARLTLTDPRRIEHHIRRERAYRALCEALLPQVFADRGGHQGPLFDTWVRHFVVAPRRDASRVSLARPADPEAAWWLDLAWTRFWGAPEGRLRIDRRDRKDVTYQSKPDPIVLGTLTGESDVLNYALHAVTSKTSFPWFAYLLLLLWTERWILASDDDDGDRLILVSPAWLKDRVGDTVAVRVWVSQPERQPVLDPGMPPVDVATGIRLAMLQGDLRPSPPRSHHSPSR